MTNPSSDGSSAISLPKGGGALKGIGETFQPNLFSGTGDYAVPLAISPGRNGFGPTLSLKYSSGNGNGPFGLGWQLSIPRVSRKTEKGLPEYDDTDVFVMSGAEDLVPFLPEDSSARPSHTVRRYRPRIEGLFARIERWQHNVTGEVHWRSITTDNTTNIYGATAGARIANPENEEQVYEWLLQETFDSFGNHLLYEYARDNPQLYTGEDPSLSLDRIFEHNRQPVQLYLRRIYYGNLADSLQDDLGQPVTYPDGTAVGHLREGRRYAFEVVFDYGDWDIPTKEPHPDPPEQQELFGPDPSVSSENNPVPIRADCFSNFRPRFEIRTLRRCRRVLMFHHFAELGSPTLVRSTDFEYQTDPDTVLSFLTAVVVTGYQKDSSGEYRSASMPPVTFRYSEFRPHEQRYQSVAARGNDMPPRALTDPNLALIDLFGDGLPDVLQSSPAGFRYWRNLGNGLLDRPRSLPQIPAGIALAQPGVGFGDLGGDGQPDLLVHSGPLPGFFETTAEETWQTFKPYDVFPSFNLADPNVRLVDLTGDGLSDALMTDENSFLWFESLGEKGFAAAQAVARKRDLDQFPDVFFSDPAGRVRLADMTGDGLNDIVLVHNGRIDYWPNLGYGRFGKRITMENAPRLEVDFDPKRLFLADLNGSGCADLVYVDFDRVRFWFNQSGNRWSNTETIAGTPIATDVGAIQFADVFGTGTATLVWSYDFVAQPDANYKALDFCGGVKPYVLTEMSNNMGATTRVSYASSTRHFLEDQANGTPWLTKLPFPVQVVDKVESIDHVSKTKLVTTYKYHHGYFDGREREFRGFGRVDKFDSEIFDDFSGPGLHGDGNLFDNNISAHHVPVVETRPWFHTGVFFDDDSTASVASSLSYRDLTERFRAEFYSADEDAFTLNEHDVETGDTPHEAYRALRGALLHTEVYAHDGTDKAAHPYTVTESRYRIKQLQPRDGNKNAVYFSHELESLTSHYERNPADPRISHALTLEVDAFGKSLKSLSIAYGRRQPDPALPTQADRDKQAQTLITYTESSHTNAIDDPSADPDNYRSPMPSEVRTYELTGFRPVDNSPHFSFDEWTGNEFARLNQAVELEYEETPNETQEQKRLVEHVRTYYRRNDLTDLLPLGTLESLALSGENYKLVFTAGLLGQVYDTRVNDLMLAVDAGYVHTEGDVNTWWIPSGRAFHSPNNSDTPAQELAFALQHFFLQCRTHDPFGSANVTEYDPYDLLPRRSIDALGNVTLATHDYRMLQTVRVTDPNGNRNEAAFDTLGMMVATAVSGKVTETLGDSLAAFESDLTPQQREQFFNDPLGQAALLLGEATTRIVYDIDRFHATQQPLYTATIARETHSSDPLPDGGLKVQVSFSYSDGYGREIQKKLQAEPGPIDDEGPLVSPRWIASGWTIFNNKGKPVQQYDPFFESTHEFRFANKVGLSSTVFYDPAERIVVTLHPNHTWEKVVFNPWREEIWDVSDTVLSSDPTTDPDVGSFFEGLEESEYTPTWHEARQAGDLGPEEQVAAAKSAVHAGTPTVAHLDSLARTFLTVTHNRFERAGVVVEEKLSSRIVFDIEGNQREIIDAKDRVVMRYDYDVLGTKIHQASMDAGERWTLNDAASNPIYIFDSRNHRLRFTFDQLRRPLDSFLREGTGAERLVRRTAYGETQPSPEVNNQRGKAVQTFDQSGVTTSDEYDFKGNLLSNRRQLAREFRSVLDWLADPELEPESFGTRTIYDALNRPSAVTAPDQSVYRSTFNESNLLEKVEVQLRGAPQRTVFVSNIDYDAKGQRLRVEYGNGVTTTHEYDPLTFRLTHLLTLRGTERLQDLSYTYDATGNITRITDNAQQTIYFNNQVVTPSNDYTYDALYRLIFAEGREHIGQVSQPETTFDDQFRVKLPHPSDGQAMRRYTEDYRYDEAGNVLEVIHQAVNGNWTRSYEYNDPSNRLTSTQVGSGTPEIYPHDAHGNITAMQHLAGMDYDFNDHMQHVDMGGGGNAFYVYDSTGRRARKVVEKNGGALIEERIYLGSFEIFRRRTSSGTITLERETLHVMDDQERIALVETRTAGDDGSAAQLVRYQFDNHLGSSALELDDQAQIISYEEYYPYGSTSYQAGRSAAEVNLKRYRFMGKERDEETGFNYCGARYYAPWLARWTSTDPAGLVDGVNLYQYSRSNPVVRSDATGTDSNETDKRRTYRLGLTFNKNGLEWNPLADSELNTNLSELAFGGLSKLSESISPKNEWLQLGWYTLILATEFLGVTVPSHEGGHYDEALEQHLSPSLNWTVIVPTSTSPGGTPTNDALFSAAGINQNWLNSRQLYRSWHLSGQRNAADKMASWLNQTYFLNYVVRAGFEIGDPDSQDILEYIRNTGVSLDELGWAAFGITQLNFLSEAYAKEFEGLTRKVAAPRFQALLPTSGNLLYGIQTFVKPFWIVPLTEVNIDTDFDSKFSASFQFHNVLSAGGFTFSPFFSVSDSGKSGISAGTDVTYFFNKRVGVEAKVEIRGENPLNEIERKPTGLQGAINTLLRF